MPICIAVSLMYYSFPIWNSACWPPYYYSNPQVLFVFTPTVIVIVMSPFVLFLHFNLFSLIINLGHWPKFFSLSSFYAIHSSQDAQKSPAIPCPKPVTCDIAQTPQMLSHWYSKLDKYFNNICQFWVNPHDFNFFLLFPVFQFIFRDAHHWLSSGQGTGVLRLREMWTPDHVSSV